MSLLSSDAPLYILLATYNGAHYLAEQIESIRRQTHGHWRLLIRDDGSTDQTIPLIREFAARDQRIELLDDGRTHLGVVGNFAALAEAARLRGARYASFADQDDVWHPQKLAWQLKCLTQAEQESGLAVPVAVHTDLEVVDAQLNRRHASFLRYQGLWHEPDRPLRTLLVQNFVTGCTLMVNRALLELALPVPREALVHDWWFALCAAAAGRLEFLPQATVRYRQHGGNTIGAKRWWSPRLWPKLRRLSQPGRSLITAVNQAAALRDRLSKDASPEVLHGFTTMLQAHRARRRLQIIRSLGIHRQGRVRNAVLCGQICLTQVPVQYAV